MIISFSIKESFEVLCSASYYCKQVFLLILDSFFSLRMSAKAYSESLLRATEKYLVFFYPTLEGHLKHSTEVSCEAPEGII